MIFKRHVLARRLSDLLPLVLLGALGLYSVWPWLPLPRREARPRTIAFYGFSILGEVMNTRVFPAFEAEWQARTGDRVQFVSAFASSGTVANQVIMGVPAEFALFSLELDAQKIAKAGVVPDGSWRKLPHEGVVNRTPFVILTRPGNPKGVHDFADCAKPGVEVVHPKLLR